MINELERLEKEAKFLEPSAEDRLAVREEVIKYTEQFINGIDSLNAYNETTEKGKKIYEHPIQDNPIDIKKAIEIFEKNVDFPGLNPASGGHLGYIPGGGIYYSALGDYLADITNRYAGVFFASPGAVRMENMLIKWMGEIIGWKGTFGGNLASGGSISNLIAIVTARDKRKITSKNITKSVIYASPHQHHCLDKALKIGGLNEAILRYLPLDENYKIIPEELEKQINADKEEGLIPQLIIASAGTTDVGAVDPLTEIGAISKKYDLWYHIDAAYGGFFVLCKEGKEKLKGIELADSVVMDPHKGLFLPYGLGVVLIKDIGALHQSHKYQANYMQDTLGVDEEPSPAELSPELTKPFRGLRLWLPLQLHGVKPFKASVEEKMLLAKYFHQEMSELENWEVGPSPELSVVTFRYLPKEINANEFNKKLVEKIKLDGRVFLSSTLLDGDKFVIRLAVLSFRTHKHTIDLTMDILKEKVAELESLPN